MNYLIGENLTGGYGGADIIRNCNISVSTGEIAVVAVSYTHLTLPTKA